MDVPLHLENLKTAVRTTAGGIGSMGSNYRSLLWPILPHYAGQEGAAINMRSVGDNAPAAQALLKKINRSSPSSKSELLAMLNFKTTTDPSLYDAPVEILSRVLPSLDICLLTCYNMICNSDIHVKYIPSTIQENTERLLVFKEILKTYMPKTYEALEAMHALEFEYLDLMFKDFFLSILPESAIISLMDSFLIEGEKALFRYAVALIKMYKGKIKSGNILSAKHFWDMVQSDFKHSAGPVNDAKVAQLREFAFEIGRSMILKAARPMKIGKADLAEFRASVK